MILKNCEGVGIIENICMILKPKFTYKYLNKFLNFIIKRDDRHMLLYYSNKRDCD